MLFKLFDNFEKKKCLEILSEHGLTVRGDHWWIRYPKRGIQEIFAMLQNTNATLVRCDEKLIWRETITNNFSSNFTISIEARENHPHEMPKVHLDQPQIEPSNKIHMYKDGSLCLMHSNEYNSRISILEIRNLAAAWCWCIEVYTNTGEWPAAEFKH